mmetsp:Transcript_7412/g.10839  ORF Transcript_7412/g.10839 Transcript_7412/m.10839 type:complete len:96 (-) Transcript_7412:247-534(-)
MRLLKEKELSKYTIQNTSIDTPSASNDGIGVSRGNVATIDMDNSQRHREVSMQNGEDATKTVKGGSDANINYDDADFWKQDEVLDEQLFEFLLND